MWQETCERSRLCQEQKDVAAAGFFWGGVRQGGVFNRCFLGRCPPKIERISWPKLVGAFKVVLAGSRLGKPGVFNQRGAY